MSNTPNDLVRPSRDGDQFHYARAARLCLQLLQPGAILKAVTIEGTSSQDAIRGGEDVIDLALYEGSIDPEKATRVAYRQFKHSTRHSDQDTTASGLVKTLEGFAERYTALVEKLGRNAVLDRFAFEFETNRPIAGTVVSALKKFAEAIVNDAPSPAEKYLRFKLLPKASDLQGFAQCVRLLPRSEGYIEQRKLLEQDFQCYLPDSDKDAPLQLKELVTRKATSQFLSNPQITRHDVLECLGTNEGELFPAPNLIEPLEKVVDREGMNQIAEKIVNSRKPILIQADGGIGKSVLTQRLSQHMPDGSFVFVYDCFGNGGYRSFSEYRHRAKDGLVQLANEMATAGLCDPLIPSNKSDETAFARAFKSRVGQASGVLEKSNTALLLIVIDAADNAEMAAAEANDGPSFARLLLREKWPENVRLVATSRPHRTGILKPPAETVVLSLQPFTEAESARNLRMHFPMAQDADVQEFHRLTSENPRVQSAALATGKKLHRVLASLGPSPKTVDDTIGMLLETAVSRVRDSASGVEQRQIDDVCTALATLRPFVPMDVIAAMAGVDPHLVRSIANDLQRPLIVREDAVQFRDEPTETWFRERFRPSGEDLTVFAAKLEPLASSSAYVAAVLPAILLQAGQFDRLVELALKGAALPDGSPIARRDVELQRLQFAIKAALRSKRYVDAAKLTLKTGGEAAADERQQELLCRNTDLAARFLDPDQLLEQVSRRQITGGNWTGSEHAYEAALLSGRPQLAGDARSKLRLAEEWLRHWSRSKRTDEDNANSMEDEDIAELIFAELNLHGTQRCAEQLRRWRPRNVSFRVGRLVISRLLDAGRIAEVQELGICAGNDLGLTLAVAVELEKIGRLPPKAMVVRSLNLLASKHLKSLEDSDRQGEEKQVAAVVAMVAFGAQWRTHPRPLLANILSRYLPKYPPRGLAGRFQYEQARRSYYFRAYALRAELRSQALSASKLADLETRQKLRQKRHYDQDLEHFRRTVEIMLPWHGLFAKVILGRIGKKELSQEVDLALTASKKARGYTYSDDAATADEIAIIWQQMLIVTASGKRAWKKHVEWCTMRERPLYTPTLNRMAHTAALNGKAGHALSFAKQSHSLGAEERSDAETDADNLISICRALFSASEAEARGYFNEAIVVAGKIGSENLSRWDAMLHLAYAATEEGTTADSKTAYRFARGAELTYHYVVRDKHFDWDFTAAALARLSPTSAIAILSRWADRRFGRHDQLLSEVNETLCKIGKLEWAIPLAMMPFDAYWALPDIFEQAVCKPSAKTKRPSEETSRRHEVFWRYARFKSTSASNWAEIVEACERINLDPSEALARGTQSKTLEAKREERDHRNWTPSPAKKPNWQRIFKGLDLTRAANVSEALRRYKDVGLQANIEDFMSEAFNKIRAGQEAGFLNALTACLEIGWYETRALLERYPAAWESQLSAKKSLQALLKAKFRENCFRVSASRHYQLLPLDLASERSGLSRIELVAEAVEAIGSLAVPTSASNLFQLTGLTAILLSSSEAHEVLEYGLDLLDNMHEPADGDGDWADHLTPPETVEAAVAGYLWGALASPEAARRWEAAHAVRNLSFLGCREILAELVMFASSRSCSAFVDGELRFYEMHALQWLLIALARSALESPASVAPHADFLLGIAQRSNPHVLTRLFASRALLALEEKQAIDLSGEEVDILCSINDSTLRKVRTKPSTTRQRKARRERKFEDERFSFDLDFSKKFLHPLARPFRMDDAEVEIEAERVIRDDWALDDKGHWEQDERAKRKFFRDDWRSSRGKSGKADDLSFYLSYHATMILAGKLLQERRLREHPEHDWTTFADWVADNDIALTEGSWLFDRRDVVPSDCIGLPEFGEEEWAGGLSQSFVETLPIHADGRIVVSGNWNTYSGRRRQGVSIASAFATKSKAAALARALQSFSDPFDYKLPDFEEHAEIDQRGYQLKGWIAEVGRHDGLDKLDPWVAGIPTRETVIGKSVFQQLGLKRGSDGRFWESQYPGVTLASEVWSDGTDNEDDRNSSGNRIVVSRDLIERVMAESGLSLIMEVRVSRELTYGKYDTPRSGKKRNDKASITKILLFEPNKAPITFRPYCQTRKSDRRRAYHA